MNRPDPLQELIDEQAAQWVARLGAKPLNPHEQQRLDQWLAANNDHQRAFHEARAAWALMGQLQCADASIPARSLHWRKRLAAAAGVLTISLGLMFGTGVSPEQWLADHRTAKGERQQLLLSDGSKLDLGPASAVTLDYDNEFRRVRLLSGMAYFEVAPMGAHEQRPFVVIADGGQVRALGTAFMVQQLADSVMVAVTEHSVEVTLMEATLTEATLTEATSTEQAGAANRRLVSEGQQTRYSNTLGDVTTANTDMSTAWRRERLIFDQLPLEDVAAILSRYSGKRILISDAGLAKRHVSGVFAIHDPDAVLTTIATELNLKVTPMPFFATFLHR